MSCFFCIRYVSDGYVRLCAILGKSDWGWILCKYVCVCVLPPSSELQTRLTLAQHDPV